MNPTRILNKFYFARRQKAIEKYAQHAEELQMEVMHHLISSAKDTLWGKDHNFGNIDGYQDFASFMSVNSYEELKSYIHQMREGKPDILWPGKVVWFAKSSGTTNDKSKFIPVSKEGQKGIHYKGGTSVRFSSRTFLKPST